jgi:DNA-binding GntR family transcriptional regulator
MKRPTAEERAHREILRLIVSQRYAPGDRIFENELAEELGLSRTPIRNALRKLLAEGILENEGGLGCFIPKLTPSDMENVFQTRILLESRAAAIAAKTATRVRSSGWRPCSGRSRISTRRDSRTSTPPSTSASTWASRP